MSQPASSTSSASLRGVDLAAVQANLRALGHDVDEAQLVSMLRNIDIREVLGRSTRGTQDFMNPLQAEPVARSASSVAAASDELQRRTDRSSVSDASLDGRTQKSSNGTVATTRARRQRSRSSCSESYRSDVTADSHGETHLSDETPRDSTGSSSLSTSRRSMASSATIPALPSDVPEENSSCSSYSWYCDAAYSASSPASSRRARRAAGRTSHSSSGSGDAMSVMSGAASASFQSTASFSALPQPLPSYVYQALPCKMPQTDRLARWRQYQQAWERDPFLTAGGDCKVSKRPKEHFGEFFAQEHMLLAMEREAYIKGRGTAFISEDGADEEEEL